AALVALLTKGDEAVPARRARLGVLQETRLRQRGRFPEQVRRPRSDSDASHAPRHGPARERPEGPRPRRVPQGEELQSQGSRSRGEDPRTNPQLHKADRPALRAAAQGASEAVAEGSTADRSTPNSRAMSVDFRSSFA